MMRKRTTCLLLATLFCQHQYLVKSLRVTASCGATSISASRRSFIASTPSIGAAVLGGAGLLPAWAQDEKRTGLSNEAIADVVLKDLVDNQFLVNGRLTRSIYDEGATFTDEIDTYGLEQWMKGTQKLFVGSKSHVDLVGDIKASLKEVEFRFSERLTFNIPFNPYVDLTGKVVLTRGENGLINHYQEYWDQSVKDVILSAKF